MPVQGRTRDLGGCLGFRVGLGFGGLGFMVLWLRLGVGAQGSIFGGSGLLMLLNRGAFITRISLGYIDCSM